MTKKRTMPLVRNLNCSGLLKLPPRVLCSLILLHQWSHHRIQCSVRLPFICIIQKSPCLPHPPTSMLHIISFIPLKLMYRQQSVLLHLLMLPLKEAKKEKTPMSILKTMEYPCSRKSSKDFILRTGCGQLWGVLVLFKMVR